MRSEMAQVEKEGFLSVALNEAHCLMIHPVNQILRVRQHLFPASAVPGDQLGAEHVGKEIGSIADAFDLGHQLLVETVIGSPQFKRSLVMSIPRKVPLPDHTGGIAGRLESLRDRHMPSCERGRRVRSQVVDQTMPCRILASEKTGAVGGADGSGRVGLRQPDAFPGKLVQMGSFVEPIAVATQLRPAQIIGQDEDNVWGTTRSRRTQADYQKSREPDN